MENTARTYDRETLTALLARLEDDYRHALMDTEERGVLYDRIVKLRRTLAY